MDRQVKGIYVPKAAFYFDQTRCGGCQACTVACKDWNQINPGLVNWRKQFTYEVDTSEGKRFFPFAMGCNHCDEPACQNACPRGAITKEPQTGIVTLHRDQCTSIKTCIRACPFNKISIADDRQEPETLNTWQVRHPAQKCGACLESRLNNGLKPACVLSCVGRALDFGGIDEILGLYPDAVRLNPTDFPYAYVNNRTDTKPNLFIKKMPPTGGLTSESGVGGLKIHRSPTYTGKF